MISAMVNGIEGELAGCQGIHSLARGKQSKNLSVYIYFLPNADQVQDVYQETRHDVVGEVRRLPRG